MDRQMDKGMEGKTIIAKNRNTIGPCLELQKLYVHAYLQAQSQVHVEMSHCVHNYLFIGQQPLLYVSDCKEKEIV